MERASASRTDWPNRDWSNPGEMGPIAAPGARGPGIATVAVSGDQGVSDTHRQHAPFWIASGPGSVLSFTAGGVNQIQEYNPATHGFTSYSVATASLGSSSYITTGDDGNLYFTVSASNAIEQLNPVTHVITAFPIPTAGLGPQYITTGSNGDLYFTASGANVIEQLNPTTNVFTTIFILTANSGATGITSGPDNSLWFIESTANKIGETQSGTKR